MSLSCWARSVYGVFISTGSPSNAIQRLGAAVCGWTIREMEGGRKGGKGCRKGGRNGRRKRWTEGGRGREREGRGEREGEREREGGRERQGGEREGEREIDEGRKGGRDGRREGEIGGGRKNIFTQERETRETKKAAE